MKKTFIVCVESINGKRFSPSSLMSFSINKFFKFKREFTGGINSQNKGFFMYRFVTFLMEREDITNLGELLKALRGKGLLDKTQVEMAKYLDIKPDRLLDIEKGKTKKISKALYEKIANRIGIPAEQLISKFNREIPAKRESNALFHRG